MMIISFVLIFILFLIWSTLMLKGSLDKLDNKFYSKIKITSLKTKIFKCITFLADAKLIAFLCLILLILIANKRTPIAIIINMLIMWALISILKRTFKRKRPNINRLVNEKGYSYPSGHTMTAIIFYGFNIFLIIVSNIYMPLKISLIIILSTLILLIGYTRIYLGVHYLSDVLASIFLGTSYLLLYIYFTYFIINFI